VILEALALGEDGSHTSTTERSTEPMPAEPIAVRGLMKGRCRPVPLAGGPGQLS
jgi:hypothetical protein